MKKSEVVHEDERRQRLCRRAGCFCTEEDAMSEPTPEERVKATFVSMLDYSICEKHGKANEDGCFICAEIRAAVAAETVKLREADSEITRLTAELKLSGSAICAQIDTNQGLRETLEFYADPDHWESVHYLVPEANEDHGKFAREALVLGGAPSASEESGDG